MTTPDPTPSPASPSLPPAPWILLDRTTVDQAAAALAQLEGWLTSGDSPAASCAHTLSCGSAKTTRSVSPRWVGTLASPAPTPGSRRPTRGRDRSRRPPPLPDELRPRCCAGCGCPTSAPPHPTCWPPPARSAGTPPRPCACCSPRRSPAATTATRRASPAQRRSASRERPSRPGARLTAPLPAPTQHAYLGTLEFAPAENVVFLGPPEAG